MRKDILKTGKKKFLLFAKLKIQFYVISDLNGEPIDGNFYEQELQRTNQQEFRKKK